MSDWPSFHLPLPPPEDHSPDCVCQSCFQIHVQRQGYSREVVEGLATQIGARLGIDGLLWWLWDLNKNLPYPIREDELVAIVKARVKPWDEEGMTRPTPKAISRPTRKKGFTVK